LAFRYAVRYAIVSIVEALALACSHILEVKYSIAPEAYSEVLSRLAG